MEDRRPAGLEAGLFLLVVALPLAFFPLASHPFSEPKLVVLLAGTLILWLSAPRIDRRVALAAAVWALASILAATAGVDPLGSLVGPWESTGLLLLLACAALAAVGPTLPMTAIERARGWFVAAAVVVAGVAVLAAIARGPLDALVADLSFSGSTLGNPVFAIAIGGAAIPAAVAGHLRPWTLAAVMVALGAGMAATAQRSSLLIPVVALLATWWAVRPPAIRLTIAAGALVATIGAWALIGPLVSEEGGLGSVRGQFETIDSERERLAVWSANARAVTRRPVLGWGPGLAHGAYVASATPSELELAGRGWADAHALPLQVATTTGVLGLAGLLVLGWTLAPGVLRPSRDTGWTAAAAITLAVFVLYEPLNVVVTPLLFLFAAEANHDRLHDGRPSGIVRATVASALAVAVLLATVVAVASTFEQWGRTHVATSALRSSLRLQPWRLSATEPLAIDLALAGRSGDAEAAAEARRVIADAVADHPWDPGVRLTAADVELLLGDRDAAERWRRRHLERFPADELPPASAGS